MKTLFDQNLDLISEISIAYSHKLKPSQQQNITSSADSHKIAVSVWKDIDYRESFAALLLSRGSKFLGIFWVSTGGINGTVVDIRMILQAALKANATSIILAHNHPSGTLRPSDADIKITRKIKEAATICDFTLLDHIIITSESYFSMADDGLI